MENLNPPLLSAVREVRWLMETGCSIKQAFSTYLTNNQDELSQQLRERWTLKWHSSKQPIHDLPTPYRQAFWDLVERGCAGQPVSDALNSLEQEIEREAQSELDAHLSTLPFKVLVPLLIFQFPAHMLLMLGPMLRELGRQFGG
jgi:hypothetical protein